MAASHGSQGRTYADGRDLSSYLTSATYGGEKDSPDVTTFTQTHHAYVSGLGDAEFSGEGIFDAAGTVGSDAILSGAWQNESAVFTHYPAGDAIGAAGVGADGILSKYEIEVPVDDVVRVKFEAKANEGFQRVESLEPLTSGLTGGGTASSNVDNGAASSNGGSGFLHVTALNGGTAVVKVQHSSNGSSFTDLITFDDVTAAGTALAVPVTGAVNRYLRATWAVTGGTATIHAAFSRNP